MLARAALLFVLLICVAPAYAHMMAALVAWEHMPEAARTRAAAIDDVDGLTAEVNDIRVSLPTGYVNEMKDIAKVRVVQAGYRIAEQIVGIGG